MHGIILAELKKFSDANLGPHNWGRVLSRAGLSNRTYLPTAEYPDEEVAKLVTAASQMLGLPERDVLEKFGAFIVPDLLRLYGALIDPAWRTLDVIEHTEHAIHRVARLKNPEVKPPELVTSRPSPDEVHVEYRSARRMCPIARGIVRGLSDHFGEEVIIAEPTCMLDGGSWCDLQVRRKT